MKYFATLLLICISFICASGQPTNVFSNCGTDDVHAEMLKNNPAIAALEQQLESQYQSAMTAAKKGPNGGVYILPVVVHIIHDNGPENISDARVLKGIEYLNDAFRNRNYYNPATGVDVEIEFCLAKRDMQGNAFSGIQRIQSPLTDMSTSGGSLSTLTKWDTKNYINITLVREVCLYGDCAVAGYANSPGAHGQPSDGIVMEAEYFGSSPRDGVVTAHEMGHYLGLIHTFQGGCKNDDCLQDGDRVCDTPPDNMTGPYPCDAAYNSCQTDADDPSPNNPFRSKALGGLGDQPDMHRNYMDYSAYDCYDRFSEGQKARMRFFVETARSALLSSKACLPPCPLAPLALFSLDRDSIEAGETVSTANMSVNAAGYRWYVDGQLVSLSTDTMFQFKQEGVYVLRLEALSPSVECDNAALERTVKVVCPVQAAFTYAQQGNWLHFSSQAVRTDSVNWTVKDGSGAMLFTSTNSSDSLNVSALQYIQLCLDAANAFCDDRYCEYIKLVADNIEICNNSLDDDDDGLVDLFDSDCPCSDSAYQAYCRIDCEYLPDSFPVVSMKVKWISEIIDDNLVISPNIVTGDINGDGKIEIISSKSLGSWTSPIQSIVVVDGSTGNTTTEIDQSPAFTMISVADVDNDGSAEIFSLNNDTILCHYNDGNLKWKSENLMDFRGYLTNIADFNGDGIPELYVGNQILNSQTGKLLISGTEGAGCNFPFCFIKHTIAADILPASGLELAAGNTVYTVDINNLNGLSGNFITPVIAPAPVKDGFTSVADIDGDGAMDVVVVRDKSFPDGGGIWVWDPRTASIIASATAGNKGGVPFIGDVTGDCRPEIGMTFAQELRMYQYDGTPQLKLLYSLPTTDKSGFTGITMFDFNQDGKNELVYRDQTSLRILEGATGITLAVYPMKSGTGLEYPVIADVDNDGQAEILVNGYQKDSAGVIDLRVYCFESAGAPWAPARSVWNQYGYNVTNVNDDLTIPRYPQNPAAPLPGYETCLQPTCPAPYNAFLAQATFRTQQGCVQFPAVDLSVDITRYECTPDSMIFYLVVHNLSETQLTNETVQLTCYPLEAGQNPFPYEVTSWKFRRDSVNNQLILTDTIRLAGSLLQGFIGMYFIVNDAGTGANPQNYPLTGILECNYDNNKDFIALDIDPHTLDLGPDIVKCESAVLTFNAGTGFESYLWSDGTQDSIYSSGYAGLHFVETTDHCHRVYRDTVQVTINPAGNIDLGTDTLICPGEPLALSLSGDFDFIQWLPSGNVDCDTCLQVNAVTDTSLLLMAVVGKGNCFSVDTVAIDIKPAPHQAFAYNICAGDSIQISGQWLSGAGMHSLLVHAASGCDTIYEVTLMETPLISNSETVSICAGDSVFLFNQWVNQAGILSQTFTSFTGCDSTQTYEVVVTPLPHQAVAFSLCLGDSVQVGGQWLSGAGSHSIVVQGVGGCDTVYDATLSEIYPITKLDTVSICSGDSVFLFNQWVGQAGALSNTFTSAAGCDSTQTYEVMVTPLAHQAVAYSICAGDSVQVGGQWLSGAGLHSIVVQAVGGCDTVYDATLSEIYPMTKLDTVSICTGDSVFLFNQWVSQTGALSNTFTSAAGCDSTQTYEVMLTPLAHKAVAYSVCAGDSVQVGGQWLSGAGLHSIMVQAASGCDTVYDATLSEIYPITKLDTVSICTGDSVFLFNQWFSQTGALSNTFTSAAGCDSTQTYEVMLTPLAHKAVAYSVCAGDSVQVGGEWLSGTGVYSVSVPAATGCDTVYEVTLTEIQPVSRLDTATICAGDSIFLFNLWEKQAGTLSQTFTSSAGCDSTQTYAVVIAPLNHKNVAYSVCAGDSIQVAGQWLSGAGLHTVLINAISGCDTLYEVALTEIPAILHVDSLTLCPGDSVWMNNHWIKESGALTEVYTAASGCDSIQTTVVSTLEVPEAPSAQTDCDNLNVLLHIQAATSWTILWSNGDTLRQTAYKNADTARVTLYALPDCHVEFNLALPALPDTAQLPGLPDTTLYAGQPLAFDLGLDPAEWQVRWEPAALFSCDTCLSTVALPTKSTTVEVTFVHRSGCIYGSRFLIELRKVSDFYVPNVFSPNGDGANDNWTFVPPTGIERFDEVLVFDRWGNQVADWKSIPVVNWDGTFRGQPLNPAVFAYSIRFTGASGERVEKKGDVTIIR